MNGTKTSSQKSFHARPAQPWTSFGKHPVVSTILWILGTEIQTLSPNSIPSPNDESSKANILSWKDDHGGHIAEYVSRIQVKRENNPDGSSNTGSTVSSASSSSKDVTNMNHNHSSQNHSRQFFSNNPNDQDELFAASPQYGFFIPITPPQDVFPKK